MQEYSMSIVKKTVGTIKDAQFVFHGDKHWIEGKVYGHSDFGDGTYIHTSSVVSVCDNEVETRNSIYMVEWNTDSPVKQW